MQRLYACDCGHLWGTVEIHARRYELFERDAERIIESAMKEEYHDLGEMMLRSLGGQK